MSLKIINFTKALLEKLEIPIKGRDYYKDVNKGINLYVTSKGIKTFYIRKNINGKDDKIILGNFPDFSIENAVNKSHEVKNAIANGVNPKEVKRENYLMPTFQDIFNDFLEKYAKIHKKTFSEDVRRFTRLEKNLKGKKANAVSKDDIQKVHIKIGEENGKIEANRVLQLISAIYNKAIFWGLKIENPAKGIQKFKEKSRDRYLQEDELKRFYEALEKLESQDIKDYILISLYTGGRKSDILTMKWENIYFNQERFIRRNSKNGEDINIFLPQEAIDILERRRNNNSIWVFPSKTSKSGHLMEPKTSWKTLLKISKIKNLRIHDLRRTNGSYQAETGGSELVIGKSLGHKPGSEATKVYSRLSVNPVKESVERAVKKIKEYAGIEDKKD